nr:RHS repeat-associated core domain-containing protein [Micromonospora sp. DSM 115978]
MPIRVGQPATADQRRATPTPSSVRVELLPRTTATDAGISGLLLSLSRSDGVPADGAVRLEIDYSGFQYAYGADWASRLRLVAMPTCALSTPGAAGCAPTDLPARNDLSRSVVSADVTASPVGRAVSGRGPLATGESAATTAGTLVALTSGPSGGSGSFAQTDLAASSIWGHGGSTGGFNWSYAMRTPPAVGGPAPRITLGYASQSVDGRNAASNNQPSWIGEGFEFTPGYVERRYVPCSDDMGGNANNTTETGDLCWDSPNAVLSLNGKSVELLRGPDGRWHPRQEDASRIELLTDSSFNNGDNNNEYWKVVTADGTQYYFGRNRLPGWSANRPTTNSVLTVPVAGNNTDEPCNAGTFATSFCDQAWRWHLDYVVDVHGNTMSLWWAKETGHYSQNLGFANPKPYHRAGHLLKIDYGSDNRGGSEYGSAAPYVKNTPARVEFATADRCLSNCGTKNATTWPDTPWEMDCTATTNPCLTASPTFWSSKRLTTVTTRVWKAATSSYQNVDSWTLRHTFPDPGDTTRAGLWLAGITHRGLNGTTVELPEVTFGGIQMNNRVDASGNDWAQAMNWWRINKIVTETGGEIFVTYSNRECVRNSNMPADADNNRLRCFPVQWTPLGHTEPITDWFHKYVVNEVRQIDHQGESPQQVTRYQYHNPSNLALWRYDDDSIVPAKRKSWSQWRGYPTVITLVGDGADQTKTETLYFRGMSGDRLEDGSTRGVTVTGLEGGPVPDHDHFAGMPRETITWLGSTILSATINDPWRSGVTGSRGSLPVVEARYAQVQGVRTRTALDGGGWRRTTTTETFDSYGMSTLATDLGDDAVSTDTRCRAIEYARNTSGANWLLTPVRRVHGWAGDCATPTTDPLSITADTRFIFDGGAYGATPTKGSVTQVEEIEGVSGGVRQYERVASAAYDAHGRTVEATDIAGETTTTTYTPAAGGPLTQVLTTNPLLWESTVDIDPAWGGPTKSTDPNGRVTETAYDALGRTIGVWEPGRNRTSYPNDPTTGWAYTIAKNGPSSITSRTVNPNNAYDTTYQIIDSLARPRQTQTPAYGGGRILTDTFYDSTGRVWKSNGARYESGTAGTTLHLAEDGDVPSQTRTVFDAAGRPTNQIFLSENVEKWRTVTSYHGDHVRTTPPAGETATTVWSDVRGKTTSLWQHHGPAPTGGYDETQYTYQPTGRIASVIDASGNTWTYGYDIRGRQVEVSDPDKGSTTFTYNDYGDLETVTDSELNTLARTYDRLGRLLTVRDGTVTGPKRTEWVYDTTAKGLVRSSSRWIGSDEYRSETLTVDAQYRPTLTRVTIPAVEGGLAGVYNFRANYKVDGSPNTVILPAAGGLSAETLTYEYDLTYALPNRLRTNASGATYYVTQANYTNLYEPNLTTRSTALTGAGFVQSGRYYDEATGRVTRSPVIKSVAPSYVAHTYYSYDPAGNLTKIDDNPGTGTRDTQCFSYDHHRRLTQAWTPSSADCTQQPTAAGLGGPAPYWQSWGFGSPTDPKGRIGNRLTQVEHATPSGDVTTTYTYPNAGADQPHALTGLSRTDNGGTSTSTFEYDDRGNTISRPGPDGQQTLTWDPEGHLATLTDSAGNNSYVYDASGNRLISKDPAGATLHLGAMELRLASGVVSGTRYYTFNGETVAQRNTSGLTWLASDHQGTGQISVTANAAQTVSIRRQTPYGEPRGPQPAWPTQRGFVDGFKDPTGLTHLGAREYDPQTGRFISVDPLIDVGNPQQINGYTYSGNNPITFSDPDGLIYTDYQYNTDPHFGTNLNCGNIGAYTCQADYEENGGGYRKLPKGKPPTLLEELIGEAACTAIAFCRVVATFGDGVQLAVAIESGDPAEIAWALLGMVPGCPGTVCKRAAKHLAEKIVEAVGRGRKSLPGGPGPSAAQRAADDAAERAAQRAGHSDGVDAGGGWPPKSPKPSGGGGPRGGGKPSSGGPSCRHSFDPDTPVLMADGSTKPIEDVVEGDEVVAHDPETGTTRAEEVVALHINQDTALTDLTVRTPDGRTTVLHTTQHHPFWNSSLRAWTDAADLHPGQHLLTADGDAAVVTKVRNFVDSQQMRDLTVDTIHTYYVVAGRASVLVHNCNPAETARAAARNAPEDATMTAAAQFRGTNMIETGYSGPSSRPQYLEAEVFDALKHGGQMFAGDAANCAEVRACSLLIANHGAAFEARVGRPLTLADIDFITVRSSTGIPEPACLSCQSVLVRGGARDLSR